MTPFLSFVRKECTHIFRDVRTMMIVLLIPVLLMVLFGFAISTEISHIRVMTVVEQFTPDVRQQLTTLENNPYIDYQGVITEREVDAMLRSGKCAAVVMFARNGNRNIVVDASNSSISATASNYLLSILNSSPITYSEASYSSQSERPIGGTPSSSLVTIQNRYNPTGNYRHFMLPALMVMLLLLVSCFLPLLNIITEKEHGTIEQMNVTPVRRIEFILAKLIPYWVIGLVLLGFSMLLAWAVYGLTPAGNPALLFLASFLYSLCLSGFAVSIANVSSTMQQGIFVMFFFVMIFILMSGLFTPIESMPQWAQYITVAFPPRHVINVFRAVYLKGTLLSELRFEFIMLTLLAIGFNALATITYKKQN